MPGAGKSTIANGLKSKGFHVINMGNVIRDIANTKNIFPTRHNLAIIMKEMRTKYGPAIIANLIKDKIVKSDLEIIIIDGIRSYNEVNSLKEIAPTKIISVHTSADKRYDLLNSRGRSDDPNCKEYFDERDKQEIEIGVSEAIALADESISNNNLTISQLINEAYELIKTWYDRYSKSQM